MKKRKKENNPNILVEKQKFYISEFEQEAAWLSFMHREGWKLTSIRGSRYYFEKADAKDWIYELDYLDVGTAAGDYLQMYQDFNWEFVCQYDHWCYFRKQRIEGAEINTSLFSDRETKLELCKRIKKNKFSHLLSSLLLLPCAIHVLYTYSHEKYFGSVLNTVITIFCILFLCIFFISLVIYFNQIKRLNKKINELKAPH